MIKILLYSHCQTPYMYFVPMGNVYIENLYGDKLAT